MTHDDKRHGTTTLFNAFDVLDGVVLGRGKHTHAHEEFIGFRNTVERAVPAGKLIRAILDKLNRLPAPSVRSQCNRDPWSRRRATARRPSRPTHLSRCIV